MEWDSASSVLNSFLENRVCEDRRRRFRFEDVRAAVDAFRALRALPVLQAALSQTPEGDLVRIGLTRRSRLARAFVLGLTSVLIVPSDRERYLAGGSRRTLRKHWHSGTRNGLRFERVDDVSERHALIDLANEAERRHPDERYRSLVPHNVDLLAASLWWAVRDAQDVTLLLVVVAVDGEWALLRYFRTLDWTHAASRARPFGMVMLVSALAGTGVRVLATDMSPIRLEAGLREFQRRVGFRLVRVRIRGRTRRRLDNGSLIRLPPQ